MIEPHELDSFTALNLFRIIQEALQNIMKHSGAESVNICFAKNPDFSVSISDNGRGITEAKKSEEEHFGLNNMHARAKEIHAEMRFETNPGKGVLLMIQF